MNKDQIIWNNIEKFRIEKKWSKAKLARAAGTRPQALNNIRTGIRGVGPNLHKQIADALGVTVKDLMQSPPEEITEQSAPP